MHDGAVARTLVEALPRSDTCTRPGRANADPLLLEAVFQKLDQTGRCGSGGNPPCNQASWTLCEIMEAPADANGDGTLDCHPSGLPPTDTGWCYVDPAQGLGDPALVEHCPATEKRLLRFAAPDRETPATRATTVIVCVEGG